MALPILNVVGGVIDYDRFQKNATATANSQSPPSTGSTPAGKIVSRTGAVTNGSGPPPKKGGRVQGVPAYNANVPGGIGGYPGSNGNTGIGGGLDQYTVTAAGAEDRGRVIDNRSAGEKPQNSAVSDGIGLRDLKLGTWYDITFTNNAASRKIKSFDGSTYDVSAYRVEISGYTESTEFVKISVRATAGDDPDYSEAGVVDVGLILTGLGVIFVAAYFLIVKIEESPALKQLFGGTATALLLAAAAYLIFAVKS